MFPFLGNDLQQNHDADNCSSELVRPTDEPCDHKLAVFETSIVIIDPQPLFS